MRELEKPQLELKNKLSQRQAPKQPKSPSGVIGKSGEQRARRFLEDHDYHIVATNAIIHPGELDIIAWTPQRTELVFVEVKTSTSTRADHPSARLTGQKLATLIKTAQRYMASRGLHTAYRFDMITVTGNTLEHFENITW